MNKPISVLIPYNTPFNDVIDFAKRRFNSFGWFVESSDIILHRTSDHTYPFEAISHYWVRQRETCHSLTLS
jgi:hypothetical protein